MYSILVVDDEEELRQFIAAALVRAGYKVETAADGLEATSKMLETPFPLVLCDVRMPKQSGLDFVRWIREREFPTAVILMTAHGNIQDAIAATRDGAFDYLEKPISEAGLIQVVQKAERTFHLLHKISYSAPQTPGEDCVGSSRRMKQIYQLVERLGRVTTSVLIRGENGTGKELVARAIHFASPRKDGPFVAVNCAAIPDTLIESELFGHEKGAFTGAESRTIGKFQVAAGGTLFLDEIGDTSAATQAKLLRVLQDHSFTPLGSTREIRSDVRIIAATNRDLEKAIREGKFREDLFYRLSVMPLFLPPLRDRRDDIPALVHHFIDRFNLRHGKRIVGITPDALEALEGFQWPGNIRELENAIEHAFVVETSPNITLFSLPSRVRTSSRRRHDGPVTQSMDWEQGKEAFERDFIVQALALYQGRINQTAEQTRIPKNTLLRKIRKYRINPKEYERAQDSDPSKKQTTSPAH